MVFWVLYSCLELWISIESSISSVASPNRKKRTKTALTSTIHSTSKTNTTDQKDEYIEATIMLYDLHIYKFKVVINNNQ